MPTHKWDCKSNFEYCTLTDCKIENGTIVLDNATSGTVLSDVRDSTEKIYDYGEIIPKVSTPDGTNATLYVRSGWYQTYHEDLWTDWTQIAEPVSRIEYTLSLTKSKIIADYDIASLRNIYYRDDYRFMAIASNLKSVYLHNIDPNAAYADELYSILWSAKVNEAIVGFAKVGHDATVKTLYATDASTVNNVINLKNVLNDDNVRLIIEYVPRNYVYSDHKTRYFQWKYELESNSTSVSPVVRSVMANYRLNIQSNMCDEFPKFFRRL